MKSTALHLNKAVLLPCSITAFLAAISAQAQPDYGPAIWRPPSGCTKWYTSGNGHHFCVIHDMEGYYWTSISYLNTCSVSASVYYLVNGLQDTSTDKAPGEITQSVREGNYAWHAGCWNTWMWGTEHEGFASNPAWYTEAMYQASSGLQRHLMQQTTHPIDRNHVIAHGQKAVAGWSAWVNANYSFDPNCNTHTDPGPYWDWNHFMALIIGQVNNASVVSISAPASIGVGQQFTATVTMNNNGTKPWTTDSTPHNLGPQNPQDTTRWGFTRVGLPFQPVNPGQNVTFTFTATAPATAGSYPFEWKMVEDSVEWFGATAAATINVTNVNPAPPGAGTGLKGTYYDNVDFTGTSITRTDSTVNFDWSTNSPDPAIGPETFSARWQGLVEPRYTQLYTFYTKTDDGVRLWVNGQLLIDKWVDQGGVEWSGNIYLNAGQKYDIQMDYYENGAAAQASLSWSSANQAKEIIPATQLTPYLAPTPAGSGTGLQGNYYDNMDFTGTQVVRVDPTVNFNWDTGSPDGAIGVDTFSARWTGKLEARYSQTYTFYTTTDDGVRLWVNGQLLIDKWVDQGPTEWSGSIDLVAGQKYDIQMDYYENGGGARATLSWASYNQAKQIIPQSQLYVNSSAPGTGTGLQAVYYDNSDFTGTSIARIDPTVNFNWGSGSPDPAIGADTFSARWTGKVEPQYTQPYTFYTATDDGVRLWVNGVLLIDKWVDQGGTEWSGTISLTAGQKYDIQMDYYENGGGAMATLSWSSASQAKGIIPQIQLYPPNTPPSITTQPQNQSVAQGTNVTFSVTATGTPPLSYQWQKNAANIAGATLSSLALNNVQTVDAATYSVVITNAFGSVISANATLTVNIPPSITTQPQSQTVAGGANVTFSATATGTSPLGYQWRFNGANISGATLSSLTKNNVQFSDAGNYDVVVNNVAGSVTSSAAALTVNVAPTITTQPSSQTVAPGSNVTLSVAATGTAPLSYQWRFNGNNISGATASSLAKNNVQSTDVGYYSVVVSNPFGSATSADATLALNDAKVFSDTFESGNLNNWTIASGATGLAISTTQNHTSPGANSAYTDSTQDKMYHNLTALLEGHSKTTFWIYDGALNRMFGEARSYSGAGYGNGGVQQVYAAGKYTSVTLPGETYDATKYQARVLTGANAGWFNLNAAGAPARSTGWHKFEIEVLAGGTTVNFYVDGILGRQITGATYYPLDDVAIGSLGTASSTGDAYFDDVSVDYYDLPAIGTQPANQTVNAGSVVTLSVAASGNVTGYQWRKNGTPIAGATGASLVFNDVQQANAGTYGVVILNGIGPVTSANATLTVTDVVPSISTQPQSLSIVLGSNVTFSVVASGTDPLTYQWRKNAANISGATASSYSLSNVQTTDGGNYSVVVANVLGNVTSSDAVLTVLGANNPPVLGAIGNKTVNEAVALTFTASATDPDVGQTLTFSLDAGAPSGASINSASGVFSWTPTEAQGPGSYSITVRVTDNGSPAMNDFEIITVTVNEVNAAPSLAAILNQTINEGATLSFTAVGSDADIPANTLTYTLDAGAPSGASINSSSGVFSWTSSESQGGSVYTITVRVTDNGSPSLNAAQTFNVTVNEVNSAPTLAAISNQTVNELATLTLTAVGSDTDIPVQTLTYSLDAGAPSGASINASSGVFTWTPTEAQGPGTYPITVRVTDNGSPSVSATQTFNVTVNEVDIAPVLTLGTARVEEPVVNFESITDFGNDHVMFRKPSNSGSTAVFIDTTATNYALVVTSFPAGNPNAGAKAMKVGWSFLTGTTNPWVRLTTANPALIPNPIIDLGARLKFDIYADKSILLALGVRETGATAAIGANGGTTGGIEWLGATKVGSSPVPSRTIAAARWTTVEFNLPAEYCTNFSGGNSVLATGLGVLEHLAVVPNGGMGAYTLYIDNFSVVNTPTLPTTVSMNTGSILTLTAGATDADAPAQTLTYSLDAGAPAGASINSSTGAFTWTPSGGQANTTNTINVRVTDNGPGSSNAVQTFSVVVNADPLGAQSATSGAVDTGETITITWGSIAGRTYQIQATDNADSGVWVDSGAQVVATGGSTSVVVANGGSQRYYRVIEVPGGGSSDQ